MKPYSIIVDNEHVKRHGTAITRSQSFDKAGTPLAAKIVSRSDTFEDGRLVLSRSNSK